MPTISRTLYLLLFSLATIVYLIGMVAIDLMDVDASQYASISREMLETGNYWQVYHRHENYLDKPPLLFWLSALSYAILGVSDFAYRLPSFLFTLLGVFSTYRLGTLLYNANVGRMAALVLYSCQAYFLINHDVRTDTILANAVIFGVWQLYWYLKTHSFLNLFLGFTGFALAMLEKGPIGLMVPVLAFSAEFAYQRNWRLFFKWQWLLGIVIIGVWLSPMLWGLYQQYGPEGPRFFFWTQSFGRITGENVWKDDSDAFFFAHTFLWAFLPWMVLAYYGIGRGLLDLFRSQLPRTGKREVLTLAGFVLPFIALSFSHYKLPHYIFVIFPFAAIITARAVEEILSRINLRSFRIFFGIQVFICMGIWLVALLLCTLVFPLHSWLVWVIAVGFFVATLWFSRTGYLLAVRLVVPSAIAVCGVNFLLNSHFYPTLLTYQAGSMAAKYVNSQPVDKVQRMHSALYYYDGYESHAFDFYTQRITPHLRGEAVSKHPGSWLLTTEEGKEKIARLNLPITVVKEFPEFHVTMLKFPFLNPNTRGSALKKIYLLKLNPK